MAFLFCESWDTSATLADYAAKWPSPGGLFTPSYQATAGRRSSGCVRLGTTDYITKYVTSIVSGATMVVGYAFKAAAMLTHQMNMGDGTVTHVRVSFLADGTIQAWRGAGTTSLGVSSAGAWDYTSGFIYAEIKVTVDNSAGVVEVKVNGVQKLNLTSQDTQNAGTTGWTWMQIVEPISGGGNLDIDDIYLLDGSGGSHNDFLGDVRVDAHYPNANGNTSGSTPSTGSDRYATVDEPSDPNDDTDYNTVTAVGDKDTLGLQNLSNAGATLYGVQVNLWAKKAAAGVGAIAPVFRESSTDYDGTGKYLDTGYIYVSQAYNLSPAGNAWTEAIFNALEVGYKRTI